MLGVLAEDAGDLFITATFAGILKLPAGGGPLISVGTAPLLKGLSLTQAAIARVESSRLSGVEKAELLANRSRAAGANGSRFPWPQPQSSRSPQAL